MVSKAIYGAFIILITIAYIGFVNSLNFDMNYKILLYLPAIFFFIVFMFLGFRNKESSSGGYEVGSFPYDY